MLVDLEESDRFEGASHPRHTAILIGHAAEERDLLDAYRADRLPHAIILGGQAGIGKATLAWRLARFLLANPDPRSSAVQGATSLELPAGSRIAGQVSALAHPDVGLLRREVNEKTKRFFTEIRADDVRRAIALFQRAAGAGGYRICIVDSAEDLNRSSANALLKLIEEPPPKSLFLLIAHRPGLVIPTIRSRSRLIRLALLGGGQVEAILGRLGEPWSELPPEVRSQAAAKAQGSLHDALRWLDHRGSELDALTDRLLGRLPQVDWRDVHKLADQLSGRDGEPAYDAAMAAIYDWLARQVRSGAPSRAARLAPYAEVWEKVAARARETEALNLDKRPLILSIFSDLAAAVRLAAA